MKVTVEELRTLRSTLTTHRLEHEKLVTQMHALRANCQELRQQIAAATDIRDPSAVRPKTEKVGSLQSVGGESGGA